MGTAAVTAHVDRVDQERVGHDRGVGLCAERVLPCVFRLLVGNHLRVEVRERRIGCLTCAARAVFQVEEVADVGLLDGLERSILRSVGYGGEIVAHAVTGRAANEQRIDVQRREPGCDGLFAASGGEEQGERCSEGGETFHVRIF